MFLFSHIALQDSCKSSETLMGVGGGKIKPAIRFAVKYIY